LSERPSKRTVDEPSFLARSQTVATPSAAMSIAELITRPRPAGLSSGELLLGHGSPFLCRGRLFERYRPKWRGAWLSRLLHRDRSSPCSRPLALCPAGPLVLRAEVGRLPSLVPYRQRASLPRQPPRQLPTRLCPGVSGFLGADIAPAVLDGRSSVPERRASFEALQGVMGHRVGVEDVAFLAFDLLWLGGRSLQRMPYDERREERLTPTPRTDVHGPR
jgi:hypothetical protein